MIQGLLRNRSANGLKENFSARMGFRRSFVRRPQASVPSAASAPRTTPSTAYWCAGVPPTIFCRYGNDSRVTNPIA